MSTRFTIHRTDVPDGTLRPFGPLDESTGYQLKIPESFTRLVEYQEIGISMRIECLFNGDRIDVLQLTVSRGSGPVSTKALTQLSVPSVIRRISEDLIPNSRRFTNPGPQDKQSPTLATYLAQLYWFEHVSWGSPRGSIMQFMSWSRTNANFHIKKLHTAHTLPGIHSKSKRLQPSAESKS